MAGSSRWVRSVPAVGGSGAESARVEVKPFILAAICALLIAGPLAFLILDQDRNCTNPDRETLVDQSMAFPDDRGWAEVSPESQGVDSRRLENAIARFREEAPRDGVDELIIVRNGRMIWSGHDIDRVHGVWSMTKAFTSTVLGVLCDEGMCQLDTRVAEILPEFEESYPEVTFRHLVTMTSGYRAVGDWPPSDSGYLNGSSKTPLLPDERSFFPPGTHYSYWDSAMNQLGHALTRIAGESIESVFKRSIADPIRMDPEGWNWRTFSKIDGVELNGGSGNKGKHIEISARELARFGHLLLNRGRWGDRQVLSESWIDGATSPQVSADLPLGEPIAERYGEKFPFDGRGVHGFNWWVNGIGPDGERLWPGLPERTFAAKGYHNNVMFVIPEWRMVIVRLGLDGKDRRITNEDFAEFLRQIGESITVE